MRNAKGFTLIELMIVVAIIAILAALAFPAYQDYVIRTQVAEGASLVGGAKIAVAEYYHHYGAPPGSNGAAHLPTATQFNGNYVTRIDVSLGGIVTATYGNRANQALLGQTLTWQPGFGAGSTTWTCDGSSLDPRWLPSSCR